MFSARGVFTTISKVPGYCRSSRVRQKQAKRIAGNLQFRLSARASYMTLPALASPKRVMQFGTCYLQQAPKVRSMPAQGNALGFDKTKASREGGDTTV